MARKPGIGWRWPINATGLAAATVALAIALTACSSPAPAAKAEQSTTVVAQSPQASGIAAIVRKAMTTYHLRAVIVRVTKG
ncbi:MAG: hypothetical protein WB800_21855, partial [Streptosporangiaceae bacterium]